MTNLLNQFPDAPVPIWVFWCFCSATMHSITFLGTGVKERAASSKTNSETRHLPVANWGG